MTRAQLDRLGHFAWLRGFMIRRNGGKYSVIRKPDLIRMQADNLRLNDVRAAVKVAERLFTSSDPAELRHWIETATNDQEENT